MTALLCYQTVLLLLTVEPNKISAPVCYVKISGSGKASMTNLNSGQPYVQDCVCIEILKASAIYIVSKGAWLYNNCSYSLSTNLLGYYYDRGLDKYHMSSIHLRVRMRNLEDVWLKRSYIWVCYDCYFRCTAEDQKNNHQLTTNHSKFACFH